MEIKLRREEEQDCRSVEVLIREAFWNVYQPGTNDHYLVHQLRHKPQFIYELNFVATHKDRIVGSIVYVEASICSNGQNYPVVTFGPIGVLPKYQKQGIAGKLIAHTAQLARDMGYKAICIYGDPTYYTRHGFKVSKEYNIANADGKFPATLLILELYPNSLNAIQGRYIQADVYDINENEFEEFDKSFPKKLKAVTSSQERFLKMVDKFI